MQTVCSHSTFLLEFSDVTFVMKKGWITINQFFGGTQKVDTYVRELNLSGREKKHKRG